MESLTYYYRVLNLEPGSTKEDIKRAYRKLAQQWHPDKFLKQPHQLKKARERFELIKEAYDRLISSSHIEAPATNPHISVRAASAQDYYEEGILYLQEYQYEQAIESFTQAIRKKSDYLQAYQARAFILEQLGFNLRAKLDFEKIADLKRHNRPAPSQKSPADAELYFQQGLVQFQARKYGAAIEILSKAIAINPNHQEAYRYRSQAYFRRGYDQQADADFNRMRELEQQVNHSAPTTPPNSEPSACYSTWHCAHTLSRHTQTVAAVAITRDGKKLVTGSHDKTLRLWSTKTGSLLKTFSDHTKAIYCVAVSWDGKLAASGGADQTVKIWDIRTGELLRSLGNLFLGHSETITALAFSPNGQTLASAGLDKTARLWSLKSGKEIYTLKDYTAPILALAISWDGKTIVYGGEGKLLSMRHTKTGKLIRSFPIDGQPNRAVALSRQGSLLAVGSSTEIILWNSHYRKKLLQLKGHTKAISSLSFSADGQILVSGSYDKTVRLWNVSTGETIDTLTGHQAAVFSVAYSLDGKLIVSSSADKTIRLWHRA
ncbi:MAG: DnaJ domain-containing protein [Cyanobacteria bacterium P01_H01_bin.26]